MIGEGHAGFEAGCHRRAIQTTQQAFQVQAKQHLCIFFYHGSIALRRKQFVVVFLHGAL